MLRARLECVNVVEDEIGELGLILQCADAIRALRLERALIQLQRRLNRACDSGADRNT